MYIFRAILLAITTKTRGLPFQVVLTKRVPRGAPRVGCEGWDVSLGLRGGNEPHLRIVYCSLSIIVYCLLLCIVYCLLLFMVYECLFFGVCCLWFIDYYCLLSMCIVYCTAQT